MKYAVNIKKTVPTGVDRIEAEQNETASIDNSDVRVNVDIAIIDTGIDLDHPDLYVYKNANFATGAPSGDDGKGGGTHAAGTAAAIVDSGGESGGTGSGTSYGLDDSFASFSNFTKRICSAF